MNKQYYWLRPNLLGVYTALLVAVPVAIADAVVPPPIPQAVATVIPQDGKVNVRLVNQTGATITYQVIGNTKPRSLPGKSYINLQGLPTPVNITFRRQDGGLLQVTPTPQPGMLDVSLEATTDLGTDKAAMSILPNGAVSFN
jgi:hypothetical protein